MYTNLEYCKTATNRVFVVLFISVLIFSTLLPQQAAASQPMVSSGKVQTEKNSLNILVLGDSLAVGYEHEHRLNNQFKPYGIGEQIYEQALFHGHRATYANYGVLGLRTEGLKLWLDAAKQQQTIKPAAVQLGLKDPRVDTLIGDTAQLHDDIVNADLIMLSIGGNDFLQILTQLDLKKTWSSWTAAEREQLNSQLAATTENYAQQLTSILSILSELNPDVMIATQNQYLPVPKLNINGKEVYLEVDSNLANVLIDARATINNSFSEIIAEFNKKGLAIQYIDASTVIEDNALNLTSIAQLDIHPNEKGYKKLAEEYSRLIWGDYRTVEPRKEGIPLSVVVNGKEVISSYPTKLIEGRTYLVLSDITQAMGAKLGWSNKTQTATVTIDDRVVELTIDAKTYKVNGQSYTLNASPAFLDKELNKTYVPVAALSEGLGLFVEYHAKTKTVYVNR